MTPLPRVETARLVLSVPVPTDFERVLAFTLRNQDHFARFTPPPSGEPLEDALRRRIANAEAECRSGRALLLIATRRDRPLGAVLGDVHFSNVVRGAFHACHLGYKIDRDAEGQGLMSEALRGALAFAFGEMGLHRVMANYQPANERSGVLLRRLGFMVEGYARDYLHVGGAWRDHVLTSLTNERWLAPSPDPRG
jgi:ribosomal-protein-alanine N-acetyltransferase